MREQFKRTIVISLIASAVLSLVACIAGLARAEYPYDSVCEVFVKEGQGYNGGSGSLIAVSKDWALVLTCRHVVVSSGRVAFVHWTATGEKTQGKVLLVGRNQDVAMLLVPRPKGLRPIPVALAKTKTSGPITNVGYPGAKDSLEWQIGEINYCQKSRMDYTCRPVPGMSGGVTFDKNGNQIGVIVAYHADGGISSSGPYMMSFVHRFMRTTSAGWETEEVSSTPLPKAPAKAENAAPVDFEEFEGYVKDLFNEEDKKEDERFEVPPLSPDEGRLLFEDYVKPPPAVVRPAPKAPKAVTRNRSRKRHRRLRFSRRH